MSASDREKTAESCPWLSRGAMLGGLHPQDRSTTCHANLRVPADASIDIDSSCYPGNQNVVRFVYAPVIGALSFALVLCKTMDQQR